MEVLRVKLIFHRDGTRTLDRPDPSLFTTLTMLSRFHVLFRPYSFSIFTTNNTFFSPVINFIKHY